MQTDSHVEVVSADRYCTYFRRTGRIFCNHELWKLCFYTYTDKIKGHTIKNLLTFYFLCERFETCPSQCHAVWSGGGRCSLSVCLRGGSRGWLGWLVTPRLVRQPISCYYKVCDIAFSALTLWVGRQEGHLASKNWVVGCWRGYLSGARCRLAYGPADATATHCLLVL